jgi:dihydropteroate synthase
VNVTPDSFSDGGDFYDSEHTGSKALNRALELAQQGAQIIDFGGVSTRPRARLVDVATELARLIPVLEQARAQLPAHVLISVDTYSPEVAHQCAKLGYADIINDVYAGTFREVSEFPSTFHVAAHFGLGLVMMHMQGNPQTMQKNPTYTHCVSEVCAFLKERGLWAKSLGVGCCVVDPGIGFGKRLNDNLALLSAEGLESLAKIGDPVLVGLSRKTFLGELYPELIHPKERDVKTKELESQCLSFGVQVIRSHKMPCEVLH